MCFLAHSPFNSQFLLFCKLFYFYLLLLLLLCYIILLSYLFIFIFILSSPFSLLSLHPPTIYLSSPTLIPSTSKGSPSLLFIIFILFYFFSPIPKARQMMTLIAFQFLFSLIALPSGRPPISFSSPFFSPSSSSTYCHMPP